MVLVNFNQNRNEHDCQFKRVKRCINNSEGIFGRLRCFRVVIFNLNKPNKKSSGNRN